MKNKIIIGSIIGLVVLFGAVSVLASGGDFWDKVAQRAGEVLGTKLSEKISGIESLAGEEIAGSATMARKDQVGRSPSGSFDTSTSTFAYWRNTTGATTTLKDVSLSFYADTATDYSKANPVLVVTTSTNANATTTPTTPIIYQTFTTSTSEQFITTSTFTAVGLRSIAPNEYLLFMWAGGQGKANPGLIASPSSTGAFDAELFSR